jgi:4-hydroxy-2-oxoheptanedioate aldolase
MKNKMLEKISKGEKAIGAFSNFNSSAVIECMGIAGLDFVIIDTEHGLLDVESTLPLILAAERRDIVPMVRVKDTSRSSILKMLDIGAMGLVIPFIKSVDEVKKVIEYGKYVPVGQRGLGSCRGSGFGTLSGFKSITEYFETCNRETLLIPQCETAEALDCIEEVVALEGVDGIFVGPFDLSIAMGKTMQFSDTEFLAALGRVVKACKSAGKFCLILASNGAAAKDNLSKGFDGVVSIDLNFLMGGAAQYLKEIKG